MNRADKNNDEIQPEYADSLRLALVQQLPCLVLCALLLDHGRMLRLCLIAILGFWLFAMLCLARGHRKFDPVGLLFLRWGFFPLLTMVFFLNGFIHPGFSQ